KRISFAQHQSVAIKSLHGASRVVRVSGCSGVVDEIVSVTRRLTQRVRDTLQTAVGEESSSRFGITACIDALSEEVARIVFVTQRVFRIRQSNGDQIAVGIVGVVIDAVVRIRNLLNPTLRVARERNRQISRAARDSVWTKRQTVSIGVLERLEFSVSRHHVLTTISIGVLVCSRLVIDVERKEANYATR